MGWFMKIVFNSNKQKKGNKKNPQDSVVVKKDYGIDGDGHSGLWHRQVSFLSSESIKEAKERGLNVTFGDFAENFATEGVDWKSIPVGARLKLGETTLVEVTQIGKECHNKCAIYYQAGDCIMPREGIFAKVLEGGTVKR
jgi:MOSC domain-containing protein YiiM